MTYIPRARGNGPVLREKRKKCMKVSASLSQTTTVAWGTTCEAMKKIVPITLPLKKKTRIKIIIINIISSHKVWIEKEMEVNSSKNIPTTRYRNRHKLKCVGVMRDKYWLLCAE